jgi:hypothetical protein
MGLSLLARRELEVVRRVDSGLAGVNQRPHGTTLARAITCQKHPCLSLQTASQHFQIPRKSQPQTKLPIRIHSLLFKLILASELETTLIHLYRNMHIIVRTGHALI